MLPRKLYFRELKANAPEKHALIRKQWEKDNIEHRREYKKLWARKSRAV